MFCNISNALLSSIKQSYVSQFISLYRWYRTGKQKITFSSITVDIRFEVKQTGKEFFFVLHEQISNVSLYLLRLTNSTTPAIAVCNDLSNFVTHSLFILDQRSWLATTPIPVKYRRRYRLEMVEVYLSLKERGELRAFYHNMQTLVCLLFYRITFSLSVLTNSATTLQLIFIHFVFNFNFDFIIILQSVFWLLFFFFLFKLFFFLQSY